MIGDRFIVITGISCSGKTTLGRELKTRGWNSLLNFTTREPRDIEELEDYVFLTDSQFFVKKQNGDFLETIERYGCYYGASKYIPRGKTFVILDDKGRDDALKIKPNIETYYIEISREEQAKRLNKRITKQALKDRLADHILPREDSIVLDGTLSTRTLADIIEKRWE